MRSPTANQATVRRPIVWIADVHRADYDHLLADAKAEQLEIHFLSSGRELLHCWFAGAPDVCIINLQLQEFSGFDVVEMIQPYPTGTTVCLLTDKYEPEEEIRALSLGVHSYLIKPLEKTVFFALCLCPNIKRDMVRCESSSPAVDYCRNAAKTTRSIAASPCEKGGGRMKRIR